MVKTLSLVSLIAGAALIVAAGVLNAMPSGPEAHFTMGVVVIGLVLAIPGAIANMFRVRAVKQPWLAAVLNLVPFGWGYLYLGKRLYFFLALIAGAAAIVATFPIYYIMAYGVVYADPSDSANGFYATGVIVGPSALVLVLSSLHAWGMASKLRRNQIR